MRLSSWLSIATMLLLETSIVRSSALTHMPSLARRNGHNELMERSIRHYESDLERRSPQATSNNGNLTLASPDVESNSNTLQACTADLQSLTNVANAAGFAVCYNILDWHPDTSMFQADLRLFEFSQPTDQFANISMNAIGVQLVYPSSTQFNVLMNSKLTKRSLQQRQNNITQIQQFSVVGSFKTQVDMKKLNTTELSSLLIPQIQLHATSSDGNIMVSNVSSSDSIYFVVGQFKGEMTPAAITQAANPMMAQEAITKSQGFILPGTTFGIFPVGLIVTMTWTFVFLLAFGLGTLGRIRHRDIYRKRIAATSGNIGKR